MKTSGHDHGQQVAGLAAAPVAIGLLRLFGTSNHVIVAISLALLVCPLVSGLVISLLIRPSPERHGCASVRRRHTRS